MFSLCSAITLSAYILSSSIEDPQSCFYSEGSQLQLGWQYRAVMLRKCSRIYSVKLAPSQTCHALVLYACDPGARGIQTLM